MLMTSTDTPKPGLPRPLILSTFAAVYGVGYLSYMLMPLQVGALIDSLGLNEAEVGLIATAELLSLAIVLFTLAPLISSLDKRKLALSGAVLVITGHSLSALVDSYTLLLPCRIAVGLGAGMVIAAGNAVVAGHQDPQKLFAVILTLGQLQAACFLFLLPVFITQWAHAGIYGFLALWTVILLSLLLRLPGHPEIATGKALNAEKTNYRVFLLPSVLAMVLIGASDASLWTFQERIADGLGLDSETIGLVLAGALISGMLGAGCAALVGKRIGYVFPVVLGLVWMAICYLVITHTNSQTVYIVTELSYLFAYGFVIPYLFGLNGELDPEGGAMVAANGCNLVGNSIGPICAGYIIVQSGYSAVGIIISVLVLTAMFIYLLVIRKKRRDLDNAVI